MKVCKTKKQPLILNGNIVAKELYGNLPNMGGKEVSIIMIGDDKASEAYTNNIIKSCANVGLCGVKYYFNEDDVKPEAMFCCVVERCQNNNVAGVIIQRPYPQHIETIDVDNFISFNKDVDGRSEHNMFKTLYGKLNNQYTHMHEPFHYPATAKGIITLLDYYKIAVEGRSVVIISSGDIIGRPLASMLATKNATVTLCNSNTDENYLRMLTSTAEIIVSATGKPKYFNEDYLAQSCDGGCQTMNNPVIIDAGFNVDDQGNICGDVDFERVAPYVSAITPVPCGVGPMSVYCLIENCCHKLDFLEN